MPEITLDTHIRAINEFKIVSLEKIYRVRCRPIDLFTAEDLVIEEPVKAYGGYLISHNSPRGLYTMDGEIDPSYYVRTERFITLEMILNIYDHGTLLEIPSQDSRIDIMDKIDAYIRAWISYYECINERDNIPVDDLMELNRFCDKLASTIKVSDYRRDFDLEEMLSKAMLRRISVQSAKAAQNKTVDRSHESNNIKRALTKLSVIDPFERFR